MRILIIAVLLCLALALEAPTKKCCGRKDCATRCILCPPKSICGFDCIDCPICDQATESAPTKKCCGVRTCASRCIQCPPSSKCGIDCIDCPVCD